MRQSYTISVLLTVFNRKDKTLSCLKKLYSSFNNLENDNIFSLKVYLTDDGSTDGTSEVVNNNFPEVVILQGDGSLFWNKGMINSWREARKDNPDFFLWLNNDTDLYEDALSLLFNSYFKLRDPKSIVVGGTQSAFSKEMTYGAESKKEKLSPNGQLQLCDAINGNFVLVPFSVYKELGMLNNAFSHSLGDWDYGCRANNLNINAYLLPEFVGTCEANEGVRLCFDSNISIIKRMKYLYSPLGCNPFEFFIFDQTHSGMFTATKHFFSLHFKSLFPNYK
jgi:GT2 family glycosyltransferase